MPCCPVCESGTTCFFMHVDERNYWRCMRCEATFLDPSQLPEPSLEYAQYQLHRNDVDDPLYRKFLARLALPLLERLPPRQHGLDYGCGPGPALAAMLREAGHDMALFDPLFFNRQDVLVPGYDFITCSEVAEHFHQPALEFIKLGALIVPGGWLAVMTTFQSGDDNFSQWHYRRDPTHVVFYREKTFRVIAEHHGWFCEIPSPNVALLRKPA